MSQLQPRQGRPWGWCSLPLKSGGSSLLALLALQMFLSAGVVRVIQIWRVSALFLRQAFIRRETERLRYKA